MLLIFYIVFSQLAVGGLALLLVIPRDLVGRGFYRLMALIYLLVMVFARCAHLAINGNSVNFINFFRSWQGHDSIFVLVFCVLLLLYTISLWLKQSLINRTLLIVGAIFGVVWTVYSAQAYGELIDLPAGKFLLSAQFLVSAILLGSVNSGMWFGHWYLVTPDLPVIHLKRFNQIFLVSLLLSIAFFGLNVFFRWQAAEVTPFNFFHQIAFWLRIFLGFGGSALLYIIIWDCLRDKSTQRDVVGATRAATGFLYIAMLTVFIGEFCGRLLFLEVRYLL
ncbi:hypothetical protein F4X33_20655 [Candidatus Poribacteria bacterium]|nr:hypothetical protein [Candidatus Poribacteria bacterium]